MPNFIFCSACAAERACWPAAAAQGGGAAWVCWFELLWLTPPLTPMSCGHAGSRYDLHPRHWFAGQQIGIESRVFAPIVEKELTDLLQLASIQTALCFGAI